MIPKRLPNLAADGLRKGWELTVERRYYRGTYALAALFYRYEDTVVFIWYDTTRRLITSEINGVPTPYAQCTRLIRSNEGA